MLHTGDGDPKPTKTTCVFLCNAQPNGILHTTFSKEFV